MNTVEVIIDFNLNDNTYQSVMDSSIGNKFNYINRKYFLQENE